MKTDPYGRTGNLIEQICRAGNVSIIRQGFHPFSEFYVYRGDTLVRVCPSIGMAREVAASA